MRIAYVIMLLINMFVVRRKSGRSVRNTVLHSVCSHRRHLRLDNLRTLILADNRLTRIQLSTDDDGDVSSTEDDELERVIMIFIILYLVTLRFISERRKKKYWYVFSKKLRYLCAIENFGIKVLIFMLQLLWFFKR